jgi:TPR repeat protein
MNSVFTLVGKSMYKKWLAITAAVLCGIFSVSCSPENGAGPVAAEAEAPSSMDIAVAAYERADYPMALSLFRSQAEQGNANAQHLLGVMYFNGQGVQADFAEAARWHRMAAEAGVVRAQFVLGMMYFNGRGVPQNDAEATRWFRMAADRGGVQAQYRLGLMYEAGRGVDQDDAEAQRLFQLAAGQGHEGALAKIGRTPDDVSGVGDAVAGSIEN